MIDYIKVPLSIHKMGKINKYLDVELSLNPTAIMRLGLSTLHM